MDGKKYQSDFNLSEKNKALSISISDSKKSIVKLNKPNNFTICCADKPLDPINNKFFVKIDTNPNKKIWMGVCLLEVVRK